VTCRKNLNDLTDMVWYRRPMSIKS